MSVLWIAIFETFLIMLVYGSWNFAKVCLPLSEVWPLLYTTTQDINWMLNSQPNSWFANVRHYFMVILWAIIPFLLALILGLSLYVWEQPTMGNCLETSCIHYPPWIHNIGIALIVVVVAQIPLWGVVTCLYYCCAPSKSIRDVLRPTEDWGPGNKEAFKSYKKFSNALSRQKGEQRHSQ